MEEKTVKAGVGVLIFNKAGQILLGLRKSAHGNGTWCPPGGHLEYGESFERAAARETKEETGLLIAEKDLEIAGVTNDFFQESGKHYVTVVMQAQAYRGTPEIQEPDKCAEWRWFDSDKLPAELFLPIANFLRTHRLSAQ